jgi:hypothetical protein
LHGQVETFEVKLRHNFQMALTKTPRGAEKGSDEPRSAERAQYETRADSYLRRFILGLTSCVGTDRPAKLHSRTSFPLFSRGREQRLAYTMQHWLVRIEKTILLSISRRTEIYLVQYISHIRSVNITAIRDCLLKPISFALKNQCFLVL